MQKSKTLIIAMILGLKADHEMIKDIEWNADLANEMLQTQTITKDDLLTPDESGKTIFHQKEIWDHFEKIREMLQQSGDDFTLDDIVDRKIGGEETLLKQAIEHAALKKVMVADIWEGNLKKLEDVWYLSVPSYKRNGVEFEDLRCEVAALGGEELREVQLKKAGVTVKQMQDALKDGKLDPVIEKLEKAGDHLRLADALVPDSTGDHAYFSKPSWNFFQKFVDAVEGWGEELSLEFFLHRFGDRDNLVKRAATHDQLDKIFNQKIAHGKPEMLVALYEHIPDDKKSKVDLPAVLSEIEEQMYASSYPINESVSLDGLLEPLNERSEIHEKLGYEPVRPLGLKATWVFIADVNKNLAARGEVISMDHLRMKSGFDGSTCLMQAVRYGHAKEAATLLCETGADLNADDLLTPNKNGDTVLKLLAGQGKLEHFLESSLWIGRAPDLRRVWEALEESNKTQPVRDLFQDVLRSVNRMGLLGLQGRQDFNGASSMPPPAGPSTPPAGDHPQP